ncbi:MAG: gamma-glutamyl-gamma-aminobutyrate hydrolase family protein [Gammaproteobacteria bacterium]
MRRVRPIIGVISDRRTLGHHAFQVQGEKYLTAIVAGAGGYPVGLPVLGPPLDDAFDPLDVLESLDGLLLTGSPSNVEPRRYQGPASRPGTLHDPERDNSAFELIPAVIRQGIPLFAVCRGFQELNVAYGGTLHQEVHSVPGKLNHREDKGEPIEVQYAPAHEVTFRPGGLLARITGLDAAAVNSVHSQGIDQLGAGLVAEGTAPDGLIEAVTVADARGFVLGVQWHPEWRVRESEVSMAIFRAFGDACRSYRA